MLTRSGDVYSALQSLGAKTKFLSDGMVRICFADTTGI
jgi:hypothetical protein